MKFNEFVAASIAEFYKEHPDAIANTGLFWQTVTGTHLELTLTMRSVPRQQPPKYEGMVLQPPQRPVVTIATKRFELPEPVVELPVPEWAIGHNLPGGVVKPNVDCVYMFMSEAKEAGKGYMGKLSQALNAFSSQ